MEATMRPEAARTAAMMTPERIDSCRVKKIRFGVIGWSPANQDTTMAVTKL
jgi:hypothetical protein